MSRNLYLGADLGPAISAGSICDAIDAGGKILNDVDASNFPERSKLLAAEIAKAKPDLLGLQEAALWRFQEDADFTGPAGDEVRYDFLGTLLDDLRRRQYRVAVVQDEFDQELPADRDFSDATQDASPAAVRRRRGRPADDARRDPRPQGQQGEGLRARRPLQDALQGAARRRDRGQHRPRLDLGRGQGRQEDSSASSTRTSSRSATPRSARRRPASCSPRAARAHAKQLIALGDFNSGGAKDKIGPGFTIAGDEHAFNALSTSG